MVGGGCITTLSSLTRPIRWSGGHEGQFSGDLVSGFTVGGHHEQFWRGQGLQISDAIRPAFPQPMELQGHFSFALGHVHCHQAVQTSAFDYVNWIVRFRTMLYR